jgi:ABC-type Zn uptake system ZnuABC Zn-binding protein ZnuA
VPRLLIALAASVVPLALAACAGDDDDGGRLRAVATIEPVAALVREVSGDRADLNVLVGPGVDPHDYELTAADRKTLDRADVVFRIGLDLDDDFVEGALDRDRDVVLTEGLALPRADDPHVWHDADLAKAMTNRIAAALTERDPGNAEAYRQRASAFMARLEAADRDARALIETIPAANRKVVTDHDAFGYFLDRYGLTLVGTVIPGLSTAAEPSAKELAGLVDTIRREKVKAVFSEGTADPKVAQRIAADAGAKVVDTLYGDSLGEPGSGADTIDGMLRANAKTIVEALR